MADQDFKIHIITDADHNDLYDNDGF